MLLLEKNYVSKQLIETELTWEEKIERALVLWSATAEQLGHKIWGLAESDWGYNYLAISIILGNVKISNKCFIRRPALDIHQIMVLRLCCQGFQDGV